MKLRYLLSAAVLAASVAAAAEFSLDADEQRMCAQGGGCLFIPADVVNARIRAAHEAGLAQGKASCFMQI